MLLMLYRCVVLYHVCVYRCIANMLREAQADGLMTRTQILNYIGEKFRVKVNLPAWTSNADVTQFLLK